MILIEIHLKRIQVRSEKPCKPCVCFKGAVQKTALKPGICLRLFCRAEKTVPQMFGGSDGLPVKSNKQRLSLWSAQRHMGWGCDAIAGDHPWHGPLQLRDWSKSLWTERWIPWDAFHERSSVGMCTFHLLVSFGKASEHGVWMLWRWWLHLGNELGWFYNSCSCSCEVHLL